MSGRDVCFRRERSGRFTVYLDGKRAGSSATLRGARALTLALSENRIERVEGGVVFRPAFVIDLNEHSEGPHWLCGTPVVEAE